jgi:hypothetical protein
MALRDRQALLAWTTKVAVAVVGEAHKTAAQVARAARGVVAALVVVEGVAGLQSAARAALEQSDG